MTKNSKSNWPRLKKALNTLDKPALIQLIGQLATLSEANGRFLSTRFYTGKKRDGRLTPYRAVIQRELAGLGLDFTTIRSAIAEYGLATGDTAGVLELQLGCIETATTFMNEMGIHADDFYAGMYAVLTDFEERLRQNPEYYPHFDGRIRAIRDQSGAGGYGYGEDAVDILDGLIFSFDNDDL
jgi:hypothetical protein